jgi:hypothetical protein
LCVCRCRQGWMGVGGGRGVGAGWYKHPAEAQSGIDSLRAHAPACGGAYLLGWPTMCSHRTTAVSCRCQRWRVTQPGAAHLKLDMSCGRSEWCSCCCGGW